MKRLGIYLITLAARSDNAVQSSVEMWSFTGATALTVIPVSILSVFILVVGNTVWVSDGSSPATRSTEMGNTAFMLVSLKNLACTVYCLVGTVTFISDVFSLLWPTLPKAMSGQLFVARSGECGNRPSTIGTNDLPSLHKNMWANVLIKKRILTWNSFRIVFYDLLQNYWISHMSSC